MYNLSPGLNGLFLFETMHATEIIALRRFSSESCGHNVCTGKQSCRHTHLCQMTRVTRHERLEFSLTSMSSLSWCFGMPLSRDMPSHYAILCNAAGGAAEFLSIYVHKVVGWAAVTQLKNARTLGRAPTSFAMWDVGRSSTTFPDLYCDLTTVLSLSLVGDALH